LVAHHLAAEAVATSPALVLVAVDSLAVVAGPLVVVADPLVVVADPLVVVVVDARASVAGTSISN
jgi:hypothetical protein